LIISVRSLRHHGEERKALHRLAPPTAQHGSRLSLFGSSP
jgi:hypothetical protein